MVRGVRAYGAAAEHDLIDAPGRYLEAFGQPVLAHAQRREELFEENLARVHRGGRVEHAQLAEPDTLDIDETDQIVITVRISS